MSGAVPAIAAGGLAAGTLDILAAMAIAAVNGVPPVRVLQYIAGGLLGRDTFQGGAWTAALGLLLHFLIATAAASVFVLAARWWPALLRRTALWGAVYGVAVWAVMNQVVVPLSRITPRPQPLSAVALMILVHIVCVGLPIAVAARTAGDRTPASR